MTETTNEEKKAIDVQTFFLVVIDKAGNPVLLTQMPEGDVVAEREASIIDIRRACAELLAEIQTRNTVEHIAYLLSPQTPAASDQVRDALAERGFELP
jgi:hypothetical protein